MVEIMAALTNTRASFFFYKTIQADAQEICCVALQYWFVLQ